MYRLYGWKTFHINILGLPEVVMTNDIASIEYILKTNFDSYGKGPNFKYRFQSLLGDGIFNTDGDLWYKHRKTSAHLFNLNKFKTTVLDTFNDHMDTLCAIIANNAEKNVAFDIQQLMLKFTLDSIGYIAFGQDIGALKQDRVMFAEAFDYCQESINQSFFDPIWWLKRFFTPAGWWYFMSLWRVNTYAYKVVKNKREEIAQRQQEGDSATESVGGGDLLSLYLERNEKEEEKLSDQFLRDVVLNFVIAGRDTTAQALSWSIFRLCTNPEVQSCARDDILSVMKLHKIAPGEALTYECLQNMKYLEAVCMEVLRYAPCP